MDYFRVLHTRRVSSGLPPVCTWMWELGSTRDESQANLHQTSAAFFVVPDRIEHLLDSFNGITCPGK